MKRRAIAQNVGPQEVLREAGSTGDTKVIASRDYANGAPAMSVPEWLGNPPVYPDERIGEVLETDIAVCGAGTAGVAAVRAACEGGAEVVLLEKCGTAQARSGQFGFYGGELYRRWGGEESRERRDEIVAMFMRESNYRINQKVIRYWVDHSGEDLDWYLAPVMDELFVLNQSFEKPPAGVRKTVAPVHHPGMMGRAGLEEKAPSAAKKHPAPLAYHREQEMYPCYPFTADIKPGHAFVQKRSLEIAQRTQKLTCLYHTPAKSLIRAADGRVRGVIAEDFIGKVYQVLARKGVILATGGYGSNLDMLYHYCPWTRNCGVIYTGQDKNGRRPNTGDGQKMGMWIGAAMDDFPHSPITHPYTPIFGIGGFLQLNLRGERFMNEDIPGNLLFHQIIEQPGHYSWQFFDSGYAEQMQHFTSHYDIQSYPEQIAPNAFDAALKNGRMIKADTLEGLLEQVGELPVETALASIRRYNKLAKAGYDEDFGKRPDRMFALEDGPFYAYQWWPGEVLATTNGLTSDEYARVYDVDGEVIPGLYAAGNVQGSRFSGSYPLILPGISHSIALSFGRRAGNMAVQMI